MIIKQLIFSLLVLFALGDGALAELYQYADDNGSLTITNDPHTIPEKARKRVKITQEYAQNPLPGSGSSNKASDVYNRNQGDTGRAATVSAHDALPGPAQQYADPPQAQLETANTTTHFNNSSVDAFFARRFEALLEDKFKDVKDPAQIAAINADTSIDCTKYKKAMDEDLTNMAAMIKDVNRRRAQGDSELLIKLQVIWGLRHIVSMLYDAVVTPKHCQDEFGLENRERFVNINKELAGPQ